MDYKDTFPYYRDAGGGFWSRNLWRYDGNMMGYGLMHEDMIVEDMEYLQQMYPSYAKRYQGVIRNIIDKADYEGSFIYDQYPDKMTMQRMVNSIMQIIKNNEEAEYGQNGKTNDDQMLPFGENAEWKNKEGWIRELVTVLLFYEILLRRKKKSQRRYY